MTKLIVRMAECQIYFDNETRAFFPGENITGNVVISVRKRIKFHALVATFKGKSACEWSEGSGENRRSYDNKEKYFEDDCVLIGVSSNSNFLDPGQFQFPFNFQLPTNIPPSFIYGCLGASVMISYNMRVAFKMKGMMESDIKWMAYLHIMAPLVDPNQMPHLLEPATKVKEKFLCCLCCQSGPIVTRLQLEKQVFYSGEPIVFHAELDNKATNKTLGEVEAKLVKQITLLDGATANTMTFSSTAASAIIAPSINAGGEDTWNVQLNIDGSPEPTFENCKCVNVTYLFLIEVGIPSGINAKAKLPVTILTRPTSSTSQPIEAMPPVGVQPHDIPGPESSNEHPQYLSTPIVEQPVSFGHNLNDTRV